MGLFGDIKAAWTVKRVVDRLKEASAMGRLGAAAYGVVAAMVTAAVADVTKTCPDLAAQWRTILVAGIAAGLAFWASKPRENAGLKVAATALATAIATAVVANLNRVCPGLLQHAPEILTAAALAGMGHWLDSPKDK